MPCPIWGYADTTRPCRANTKQINVPRCDGPEILLQTRGIRVMETRREINERLDHSEARGNQRKARHNRAFHTPASQDSPSAGGKPCCPLWCDWASPSPHPLLHGEHGPLLR
jgi:hypothetical protein